MSAISTPFERWTRLPQILLFGLLVRPFLKFCMGLRARGLEHLPVQDPFLLVANHSSHLDAAVLLSLFSLSRSARIRPVAAADYFGRTRTRLFLSRLCFNVLPIPRGGGRRDDNPIDLMAQAIERGETLLLFPEGTRGSGEEMGAFRPGAARLLERFPTLQVVPAWLVNMGRSLPKGEVIPVPFFIEVRIGAPISPCGSRQQRLDALRGALEALRSDG